MTKRKLMLAAAVLALTAAAGTSYAMEDMPEGMPMNDMGQGGKHMMMKKEMMKVPGVSEESQKLLKDVRMKHRSIRKASHEKMKKYRDELKVIMEAEKFDKKAYIAKKAEMTAMKTKMHASKTEDMASVYEKMTAKERAAWAKHTHRGPKGKGMMKHGKMMGKGMMGDEMMRKSDCPMMKGSSDKK